MTLGESVEVERSPPPPPPPPTICRSPLRLSQSPSVVDFISLNGDPKAVSLLEIDVISVQSDGGRIPIEDEEHFLLYAAVRPQLQSGPTCGLLALSLIANLVQPVQVDDILNLAIRRKFTKEGEMFSAKNLFLLAQEVIGKHCDVQLHQHYLLPENHEKVWNDVRNCTFFLVPYDKDKDNAPGLFKGHKAHWCAVIGCSSWKGKRFFCAAQGTSMKASLWPTSQLAMSNESLLEVHPDLLESNELVTCNIEEELAGHCISIRFKNTKLKYLKRKLTPFSDGLFIS